MCTPLKQAKTPEGEVQKYGEVADLAAVKVHEPHVVWHFEIRFVEEEAGWHTYNVRSGGKKELQEENTHQSVTIRR